MDLIHINAVQGNDTVAYGMDLSEYYLNVEWDILSVPAERHVKTYPCCPEPYPGDASFTLSYLFSIGSYKYHTLGSGCSTACNREVMGWIHAGCWAFFSSILRNLSFNRPLE